MFREIKQGNFYKHYNNNQVYKILVIGRNKDSKENELLVTYQNIIKKDIWVTKYDLFIEFIEERKLYRFREINCEDKIDIIKGIDIDNKIDRIRKIRDKYSLCLKDALCFLFDEVF